MNKRVRQSSGQVGLVVLLIMVVLVTVGVSVATRSVSELRVTRQEQESTRSLNLAESGIEELLSHTLAPGNGQIIVSGQQIDYDVSQVAIGNVCVKSGHTIDIDLTGVSADWGVSWTGGSTCPGYIEVAVLNTGGGVSRHVYKNSACADQDGITSADNYPGSIAYTAGDKTARLKALYDELCFTVSGVPDQVYKVNATSTLADGTTRAVEVTKLNASLPSIFDYVLFSGQSLVK